MKRFDITYFHGPFPDYITKPEVIADIAAAGITLVPISGPVERTGRCWISSVSTV